MRVRIAATVAVLVTLALTSAGLIIYALESARLQGAATEQAEQEIAEFRTLQRDGLNPETAQPFETVLDLMRVYLEQNVPARDELFVAWLDGKPTYVSASEHHTFSATDEFADLVRPHVRDGAEYRTSSTVGNLLVTVQPVVDAEDRGALVLITFLDQGHAELLDLMRTYAIVSLLSLGVITALAGWQAGRLLAPLRRINDTAREISVTDLSLRLAESGNDDITALSRTINDMLARLEQSFIAQRQFLDAAGHELRTPLTILRGHLELVDAANPDDVVETRDMLLDEVDRMARLVNDLLLLTKSDRPDFITAVPTDLDALVQDVAAKARALGDRDWQVEGGTHGALAPVDGQRITQALLQLADNAVKHTGPGDLVAIGSELVATESLARLWVRDTGHGVPAEDQERIFDQFSRSIVLPGDEGFGLGLSIVRAIASAHGGTVHVEDNDPTGAIFVLSLPLLEEEPWPES